jgi:hypothetical protein
MRYITEFLPSTKKRSEGSDSQLVNTWPDKSRSKEATVIYILSLSYYPIFSSPYSISTFREFHSFAPVWFPLQTILFCLCFGTNILLFARFVLFCFFLRTTCSLYLIEPISIIELADCIHISKLNWKFIHWQPSPSIKFIHI